MTRDQAYEILTKYMKGENYITHSLAVEAIMKGLAKRLAPDEVEYWGIAGLLHDLDEEQCDWEHDLSVHGPTSVEILKEFSEVSSEYQIRISHLDGKDTMRIYVETNGTVDFLDLAKRIAATVKSRIGFTPLVKVVEIGLLPRSEKKTKRVIDERYE